MRPVHEFKTNFNRTEERKGQVSGNQSDTLALHDADSTVRNLCFEWPDGRRAFFNYAYLIKGEFVPGCPENVIHLDISSYKVTLQGYRLYALFTDMLDHKPRLIRAIDARYLLDAAKESKPVITGISLETKDE
ncbi:hypothetical protein [Spirosoma sp. 209]|uniref:hypothetical protein n=1 Tax=Spirosoma sp. 209 TaxID=1955701 RepID=UPI00098D382F|nr:hypothetical protein [Spirosoma sp. 209]